MEDITRDDVLSRQTFLTAAGYTVALTAALPLAPGAGPVAAVRFQAPVLDIVDVLVVGGGPAGIGAALGAAKKAVRTLLIENHSFFGGVAAWALGEPVSASVKTANWKG